MVYAFQVCTCACTCTWPHGETTEGIARLPNTVIAGYITLDYAVVCSLALLCCLWWLISSWYKSSTCVHVYRQKLAKDSSEVLPGCCLAGTHTCLPSHACRWTLNPIILKKVPAPPSDPAPSTEPRPHLSLPPAHAPVFPEDEFNVGDVIKIATDHERVKTLQSGHGEWVESMMMVGVVSS